MFRGKERRFTRAFAIALLLSVVLLSATAVALAASPSLLIPPMTEAVFRDSFNPSRLPPHGAAPVSLHLAEKIGNPDGSHPPALEELEVELDRHLGLSVKGVPRCGPLLHESPTREGALAQCEDARVGSGTIEVEVAFPEQPPVRTSGRVSVYNRGLRNGRTQFLLYAFISAPITGAIVMPLEVHRGRRGLYGWKGALTVPKIANGAGSVTYLGIRFRKGIFTARCPTGASQGRAVAVFGDGTKVSSAFIQPCRTSAASG